ncbi:metallophosphoesterase family protein [Acidobacteriota bacterium]
MKKSRLGLIGIGIVLTGLILWILFFSKKPDSIDSSRELSDIVSFEEVVIPTGNTYTDPKLFSLEEFLPFEDLPIPVTEQFKKIAPEYKELYIQKHGSKENISWSVKTKMEGKDQFTFSFLPDGKIFQISSEIDDVIENAGRGFIEGNIYEILPEKIPEPVLSRLSLFGFENKPSRAYSVKSLGGKRVFVQVGGRKDRMILSFTEKGEIRSAGREQAMLRPYRPLRIETLEEIQANLSKFGDRYHVHNVLEKIGNESVDEGKGFRFVVFGDSRSNLLVWKTIVQSINKWDPLFAINLGDLTYDGYSLRMDGYLMQVLDEYARFPFLGVVGNHDVRSGGLPYEYVFGGKYSRVYHFDVSNCRFVIMDNTGVKSAIPWEEQLEMADNWLDNDQQYKFVFVHEPLYEVEKWRYHSMTEEMSGPFAKLMSKHSVDHVFFGHIHAYSTATYDGVEYTITGGGGASLHKQFGKRGAINHYLVVDISPESIEMKVIQLIAKEE